MPDMDTTHTGNISVEQLSEWLNRPRMEIHGCLMANIDTILRLAIAHLVSFDGDEEDIDMVEEYQCQPHHNVFCNKVDYLTASLRAAEDENARLEQQKLGLLATVDAMAQENAKLREALKKIAIGTDGDNFPLMDSELRYIARESLEGK